MTWDVTTVDDTACGVLGNRLSGRGPRYRVPVRVFVFGAARVEDPSGTPVDIGARKPRSIVSALAMTPGRPVSPGLLADLVWAGDPPPAAHGALHAYISGLRKALEPDRRARAAASVLETTDHGYLVKVDADAVDVHRFAADVRAGERGLAPLASQVGDGDRSGWPSRAQTVALVEQLDEALAAWRGEPYADLPDHPDVLAERAALERLRVAAEEARLIGLLALGEHASVLSTAESTIAREPLRERLRAIHALALLRSGRQVEALDALRAFRELLAEDTGLDPSPELAHLEQAILRQDPRARRPVERAAPRPPRRRRRRGLPRRLRTSAGAPSAQELRTVLDRLAQGSPALATVIGEPGIGKSWLVRHLGDEARANGVCVASGTCSQDDGAPPLWPWLDVLRALEGDTEAGRDAGGVSLADVISAEAGASGPGQVAFQTWDRIARAVARGRPAPAGPGRPRRPPLGRRGHPARPAAPRLGDPGRRAPRRRRHASSPPRADRRPGRRRGGARPAAGPARRADRPGRGGGDRAGDGRGRGSVDPTTAEAWRQRSGGNPFFLVELARLGSTGRRGPGHRPRGRQPTAGGTAGRHAGDAAGGRGRRPVLPRRGGRRRPPAGRRGRRGRPRGRPERPAWSRTTTPRGTRSPTL